MKFTLKLLVASCFTVLFIAVGCSDTLEYGNAKDHLDNFQSVLEDETVSPNEDDEEKASLEQNDLNVEGGTTPISNTTAEVLAALPDITKIEAERVANQISELYENGEIPFCQILKASQMEDEMLYDDDGNWVFKTIMVEAENGSCYLINITFDHVVFAIFEEWGEMKAIYTKQYWVDMVLP